MRATKKAVVVGLIVVVWMFAPEGANGDVIKFKKGGAQKCIILEEDEDSVRFLSSMGEVEMARERIEYIKKESEETNQALEEKWQDQKSKSAKKEEPAEVTESEVEKPKVLRTYRVNLSKRRIMLGGRDTQLQSKQLLAKFTIEDYGMKEGSHVFRVSAISYRSGSRGLAASDFHVLSTNGVRTDPQPVADYAGLDATLRQNGAGSGYVAFPTPGSLKSMVVNSDVGSFELDLETGDFTSKEAPF